MKKSDELVRGYTEDLVVLHKHILRVMEEQADDESVQRAGASGLVRDVVFTLRTRLALYESLVAERGGGGAVGRAEEAATSLSSWLTAMYGKVRRHPAARLLRDDYTALCMLGICEEMLHTTAVAAGDVRLAGFVAQRMNDLPPLIIRVHDAVPTAVVAELAEDHGVDATAARATVDASHNAWKQAAIES